MLFTIANREKCTFITQNFRMIKCLLPILIFLSFSLDMIGQDVVAAATKFINALDSTQKARALYPFDTDERFNFHFFPKEDRKGIPLDKLDSKQQQAAFDLLRTSLSEQGVKKAKAIIELENTLKQIEHRVPDDHYRDAGKYYIVIFGLPGNHTTWGWRFEGHHLSFTFSANESKLISATPGFMGANPAIVPEGVNKGKQALKEETEMGFGLLHSLSNEQKQKAIISTQAPSDIITFVNRKAMIEHPEGIRYKEMNDQQKEKFLQLIRIYINRYTKLFADQLLKEIQEASLDELWFCWAGDDQQGIGHPHYYRIQGPTIIVEYDNTQNGANHIHTVVRDLKNDFGGDLLLQHYRESH
jgi:hypothetical protein